MAQRRFYGLLTQKGAQLKNNAPSYTPSSPEYFACPRVKIRAPQKAVALNTILKLLPLIQGALDCLNVIFLIGSPQTSHLEAEWLYSWLDYALLLLLHSILQTTRLDTQKNSSCVALSTGSL